MKMSDELFAKALVASLDDGEPAAADVEDFAERLISSDEDLEAFVEAQRFEQELREATHRRAQEVTAFDAIHDDLMKRKPHRKPTPAWVWPIVSAAAALVVGVFGSWLVFSRMHNDRLWPHAAGTSSYSAFDSRMRFVAELPGVDTSSRTRAESSLAFAAAEPASDLSGRRSLGNSNPRPEGLGSVREDFQPSSQGGGTSSVATSHAYTFARRSGRSEPQGDAFANIEATGGWDGIAQEPDGDTVPFFGSLAQNGRNFPMGGGVDASPELRAESSPAQSPGLQAWVTRPVQKARPERAPAIVAKESARDLSGRIASASSNPRPEGLGSVREGLQPSSMDADAITRDGSRIQLEPQTQDLSDEPLVDNLKGVALVPTPGDVVEGGIPDLEGVWHDLDDFPEKVGNVLNEHVGKPISLASLDQMSRDVIKAYRESDRPVVDVLVPEQDITGGVTQLVVVEGRLSSVRVQGANREEEAYLRSQIEARPVAPPKNQDGELLAKNTVKGDRWDDVKVEGTSGVYVTPSAGADGGWTGVGHMGRDHARSNALGEITVSAGDNPFGEKSSGGESAEPEVTRNLSLMSENSNRSAEAPMDFSGPARGGVAADRTIKSWEADSGANDAWAQIDHNGRSTRGTAVGHLTARPANEVNVIGGDGVSSDKAGANTPPSAAPGAVEDLGTVEAAAGDVVLAGKRVENHGTIGAVDGFVGLAGGNDVFYKSHGDQRIFIAAGEGGSQLNTGEIASAAAELRAHGSVGALSVQNDGVIRSSNAQYVDGKVVLNAGSGNIGNVGSIEKDAQWGRNGDVEVRREFYYPTEYDPPEIANGGGGEINVTSETALNFTGGAASHAYTQIGHGGHAADGNHSGDISVTSTGGTIVLNGEKQALPPSPATPGETQANRQNYAMLGHGGYQSRGKTAEDVAAPILGDIPATGRLFRNGEEPAAADSPAEVVVNAGNDVSFIAGTEGSGSNGAGRNYQMLGHGGSDADVAPEGGNTVTEVQGQIGSSHGETRIKAESLQLRSQNGGSISVWTDDETAKVNIDTSAGDRPWDVPTSGLNQLDRSYGVFGDVTVDTGGDVKVIAGDFVEAMQSSDDQPYDFDADGNGALPLYRQVGSAGKIAIDAKPARKSEAESLGWDVDNSEGDSEWDKGKDGEITVIAQNGAKTVEKYRNNEFQRYPGQFTSLRSGFGDVAQGRAETGGALAQNHSGNFTGDIVLHGNSTLMANGESSGVPVDLFDHSRVITGKQVNLDGAESVQISGTLRAIGNDGDGGTISISGEDTLVGPTGLFDSGGTAGVSPADTIIVAGSVSARGGEGSGGAVVFSGEDVLVSQTGTMGGSGSSGGAVNLSAGGELFIAGNVAGDGGGSVAIAGNAIEVVPTAQINANGSTNGGNVYIGGGFHGSDPRKERSAAAAETKNGQSNGRGIGVGALAHWYGEASGAVDQNSLDSDGDAFVQVGHGGMISGWGEGDTEPNFAQIGHGGTQPRGSMIGHVEVDAQRGSVEFGKDNLSFDVAVDHELAGDNMASMVPDVAKRGIIRRQELVAKADEAALRGERLLKDGDVEGAVGEFQKSVDLLPDAPVVQDRINEYESLLTDTSAQLGRLRAEEGRYAEAIELAEAALAPGMPENQKARKLLEDLNDPEVYTPALTPEHVARVKRVEQAQKVAQSYIRLGDHKNAKKSYNEVLNLDPYNSAARRGMEHLAEEKEKYHDTAYDHMRAHQITEVASEEELNAPQITDGKPTWMVQPNGVIVASDGAVDTSGAVLSTLDVDDNDFLHGGDVGFRGPSPSGAIQASDVLAGSFGTFGAEIGEIQLHERPHINKPVEGNARGIAKAEFLAAVPDYQSPNSQSLFAHPRQSGPNGMAVQILGTVRARSADNVGGRVVLPAAPNSEWQRYPGRVTSIQLAKVLYPEKSAAAEAFSTFSLNVSDVSFKLAQAALAEGQTPEKEKIRIEEFVNAFDYGDPMPSTSERVACQHEQAIHPFNASRNLLRIAMRTAEAGRSNSTPLRLTILLDASGSMERADRRESVKRALSLLSQQLHEGDQVNVIGFARQPKLLAEKLTGPSLSGVLSNIFTNTASEGGTNLEAALHMALEKANEFKADDAQNRVVLLTDGAANLGDAEPERLAKIVEEMRQDGIAFDAAGVGAEGLNDEVLEALTRKGDGRYYFLNRPEDADDSFAQQIAGALRPAAMNVKVQVEFNPKRVGKYKLLGYEKHRLKKEDFRNDAVDAAELAAAEAGVALYHFEPLPEGEGDVGTVSVRFRDMSSGKMVERRWPIPYEPTAPRLDDAKPSIRIATAAAMLAGKLKDDPIADAAELSELANIIRQLPPMFRKEPHVQQLLTMIDQLRNIASK